MSVGTLAVHDRKRHGPADWMGDVVSVVGAVEVRSIPASIAVSLWCAVLDRTDISLWKDNVRSYSPGTRLLRQVVSIQYRVHTRRIHASPEVWLCIAAVALLHILTQPL